MLQDNKYTLETEPTPLKESTELTILELLLQSRIVRLNLEQLVGILLRQRETH